MFVATASAARPMPFPRMSETGCMRESACGATHCRGHRERAVWCRLMRLIAATALTALFPTLGFGQATIMLPGFEVVGTAPGAGSEIARDKVPANTQTLTADDFSHERASSLPETLLQRAPGVFINDATGNFFQPNVVYR